LTGLSNAKCLFYLYSPMADTGKSLFVNTLCRVFGDYGLTANGNALAPTRDGCQSGASPHLSAMEGRRFVSISESAQGAGMDEALVKRITGGDPITSRELYRAEKTWDPQFAIWIASNHEPKINGDDNAIWNRIKIIPMTVAFPEGDPRRDDRLAEKLMAELPGIMNWVIEGARQFYAQGLGSVAEIEEATSRFRASQDPVSLFIEDRIGEGVYETEEDGWITRSAMYEHFRVWSLREGNRFPISATRFYRRLTALGYNVNYQVRGIKSIRGLRQRDGTYRVSGDPVFQSTLDFR